MKSKKDNTIGINAYPIKKMPGASEWSKSDWTMKAFLIPRTYIQLTGKIKELQYPGVYFLIGNELDSKTGEDKTLVYVGKAGLKTNRNGAIAGRLIEHLNSTTEKYKDRWQYAVAMTSLKTVKNVESGLLEQVENWGLTEISNIEHLMYQEIPSHMLLNSVTPNTGSNGTDNTDYTEIIREIKAFLIAMETGIFEDTDISDPIKITQQPENDTGETEKEAIKLGRTPVENLTPESRIPEIVTPQNVVKQVVDMLPSEVFNPNTRFLDPACKGGEFLKELYNRLMKADSLITEYPEPFARSIHILSKQLFGIALSEISRQRTIRSLMGYENNIKIIGGYISKLKGRKSGAKTDRSQKSIGDIINEAFNGGQKQEMKFDVVIGNPPYNGETDSKLYCKFMLLGSNITLRFCVMIVKSKWMTSVDKDNSLGFNDVRKEFLIKRHCLKITDFPTVGEVFPSIGTSVCYFLYDKEAQSDCEYIQIQRGKQVEHYTADFSNLGMVIKSKIMADIARKTLRGKNFSSLYIYNKPCGFETSEIPIEATLKLDEQHNIGFITSNFIYYAPLSSFDIKYHDNIKNYSVVAGQQVHVWETTPENVLTNIHIIPPNASCTGTWTQIYCTPNQNEASNFVRYLKTKFCRATIKAGYSAYGRYVNEYLRFCPMQDFTNNSDIDWTTPISDIDQQLYKKYGLTKEEIAYIESTIKPIE